MADIVLWTVYTPLILHLVRRYPLGRTLRHDVEVRSMSREIIERYEEITLLYSISEILGSVISLDAATDTILTEVAGTLGVQRATLWLQDLV